MGITSHRTQDIQQFVVLVAVTISSREASYATQRSGQKREK